MNLYEQPFHTVDISQSGFLITGGAGFIGSHIVEYLLHHGASKVRVLDNFSTGKRKNLEPFWGHKAFEIIEGDIYDANTCEAAMEDIHFVSHQAALGSVPRSIVNPIATNQANVSGFLNILWAAKEAGIQRMVYAASSSTYGNSTVLPKVEDKIGKPLSPYAVTKYVNELYGDVFSSAYNFNTVGLRYFNVFGPRQDANGAYAAVIPLFFKAALAGAAATINGDGSQTRDFTFVANAVQANILAMLHTPQLTSHEVCNIACGHNYSLNELWQKITAICGQHDLVAQYGPARKGDVLDSLADITKARNLLGYKPLYDMDEGLKTSIDWYKTPN